MIYVRIESRREGVNAAISAPSQQLFLQRERMFIKLSKSVKGGVVYYATLQRCPPVLQWCWQRQTPFEQEPRGVEFGENNPAPRSPAPNFFASPVSYLPGFLGSTKYKAEPPLCHRLMSSAKYVPQISALLGPYSEVRCRATQRAGTIFRRLSSIQGEIDLCSLECCHSQRQWGALAR